jgi:antitoxin component of MazEF toxin-antitoxin module
MADGLLLASAWALVLDLGNLFLEAKRINRIVVRSMEVLVKKGGIIELPSSILSEINLCEGKRVALSVKGGELLIKPIKSLTDQLIGSIKLDDQKLIEEIIESED